MDSIAVCIACYNRRERTISCLERLFSQVLPDNMTLEVYLFDDNSPDGTAKEVIERYPRIHLYKGDGSQFWAGGMRIAYGAALAEQHKYYIWLNDDVELFSQTIKKLIETEQSQTISLGGEHVVVGAMCSRDLKVTTYSGFVRSSAVLPWKFRRVIPDLQVPIECDTMNGNIILIPQSIALKVGNINPSFKQMHADIVLGLLARRVGARNWIMPGHAGICDTNINGRKNWLAPGLKFRERLKSMEHPLGYPLKASIAYSHYFGIWATIMIVAPYISLVMATLGFRSRHIHN